MNNLFLSSPKISIIVPVYNVEKYLRHCLDSIRAQTFTDFECICIDDGSSDGSGKILDEYAEKDSRFVVIHKDNGGVSSARNAGLDVARGEWLAFVDSDDWVEKDFLFEQFSDGTSGDFEAVVCGMFGRGKPRHTEMNRVSAKRGIFKRGGFGGYSVLYLIKRRNVGTLCFDETVHFMEDNLFFWKFFDNCNAILWTDKPLYHYEANVASVTHLPGLTAQAKTAVNAMNHIINMEQNRSVRNHAKSMLLLFYGNLLTQYVYSGQEKSGFEECLSLVRRNYLKILTNVHIPVKRKILLTFLLLEPDFEKNRFAVILRNRHRNMEVYHDSLKNS